MTVYQRAMRHVRLMLLNVAVGAAFVVAVDRWFGHSTWAFAIVIVVLLAINFRLWRYACPQCGSNLFMRSWIILPWPNAKCDNCGKDLKNEALPPR